MARSTYVYILEHAHKILAACTVKHELMSILDSEVKAERVSRWSGHKVTRIRDGNMKDEPEVWSGWEYYNENK